MDCPDAGKRKDPYAYVEAALQAPPSPDYVPSPEEPEQAPPSPDFIPGPIYPEFMPPEDDVLPAEEQPLPAAVSPAADSPGYITDSDPDEDDKDPEEDPADYPDDKDDNDDEEESSRDDADDKEEDEGKDEDEEEEEEHLASTNSVPPPAYHTTARMSIQDQTPIPFPSAAEVDRFLAISTLPPSPLTSYSSLLLQIPSPPLLVWHLDQRPTTTQGHHTFYLYLLPTLLLPLLLPSTDCRAGVFEVTLPPQKRRDYGFVTTLDDEIRRDLERDVSYGITDTWDEMVEDMQGTPSVTYVAELSQSMIDFVMTIRQDTNEIDGRLDDAQDDRSLMSGQFNLLRMDKRAHARTARLIEIEARLSRDTQMAVLESQQTPARDPVHLDVPEEAGSSS
ncbi:hypothetical protein Tco_0793152 [Tanacetum coccineum]